MIHKEAFGLRIKRLPPTLDSSSLTSLVAVAEDKSGLYYEVQSSTSVKLKVESDNPWLQSRSWYQCIETIVVRTVHNNILDVF